MQTILKTDAGIVIDGVLYAPVANHTMPVETEVNPPIAEDADGPEVDETPTASGTVTHRKTPYGSTTPLFKVRYTSNGGRTAVYGVFWVGDKDGERRYGLRALIKGGWRMKKPTRFAKGFFVAADRCTVLA